MSTVGYPPRRMHSEPPLASRAVLILVLLLVAANLLVGNATTSVWDQDEAAYAGLARSMLVDGQWVVPHFPHTQPHRKPPLMFWLIAGSYAVFGVNEFALRLPSVLAIAGTGACVWFGARFLVGRATAQLGALVLVSALFVANLGKLALLDAVLLFFQTVAALALLRGAARPSSKATVILWLAVAAALLAKGPPILILVAGMFLFLLIFSPQRRNLISLHPWFGLPLALLPLFVWIYLAWQEDQRYVLFLGYWYVLRRVGGSTFGHAGLPGTYFLLLFPCLVPWTGYLLPALGDAWRQIRRRRLAYLLIAAWLVGGWILWEPLSSKLPTYTLGAFPALALLLARQVERNTSGRLSWAASRALRAGHHVLVVLLFILAVAAVVVALWLGTTWAKALAVLPAGAAILTGVLAVRWQRRGTAQRAVAALLLGGLATNLLLWAVVVQGIEDQRAVIRNLAGYVAAHSAPGTTLVTVKATSLPSLPFYALRAGLTFRDILGETEPRARLDVDFSLLWKFKFRELARQVKAQNPTELPPEDKARVRLARAADLWQSPQPCALVLDEQQYGVLRDVLGAAPVARFTGWSPDQPDKSTYLVVISPAAYQAAPASVLP